MARTIPYDFILDYLPRDVVVKQTFGMYYIYLDKKIVLLLRKLSKNLNLNGIWIATMKEYHESLKLDIPAIAGFVLDNGEMHDSGWQMIREDDDDFEASAIRVCELISHRDKRIGKETNKGISL